jgi:hypothetical protein
MPAASAGWDMPAPKRPQREPTDDWDQLRLWVTSPEQETYELLGPIILFGRTPAVRATETGMSERTLRRRAERVEERGMASLFETITPPAIDRRTLPEEIRQAILALKAEYPAFTPNEIATMCRFRFDRPVHRQTVQRLLATTPVPTLVGRRYPMYHAFPDPAGRRLAIVQLYLKEGWSVTSIAGYLATTRPRIYETLRRWFEEGVPGLDDHSRAPKQPARVLGFVQSSWCDPAELNRLFRLRAERRIDAGGYVRFRHWRIYGERGLDGHEAAIWVIGEQVAIEHATTTVSAYEVAYAPGGYQLREVSNPRCFETSYQSLQPFLAPLDELPWQPVYRVPAYAARRPRGTVLQLRLLPIEEAWQTAAS